MDHPEVHIASFSPIIKLFTSEFSGITAYSRAYLSQVCIDDNNNVVTKYGVWDECPPMIHDIIDKMTTIDTLQCIAKVSSSGYIFTLWLCKRRDLPCSWLDDCLTNFILDKATVVASRFALCDNESLQIIEVNRGWLRRASNNKSVSVLCGPSSSSILQAHLRTLIQCTLVLCYKDRQLYWEMFGYKTILYDEHIHSVQSIIILDDFDRLVQDNVKYCAFLNTMQSIPLNTKVWVLRLLCDVPEFIFWIRYLHLTGCNNSTYMKLWMESDWRVARERMHKPKLRYTLLEKDQPVMSQLATLQNNGVWLPHGMHQHLHPHPQPDEKCSICMDEPCSVMFDACMHSCCRKCFHEYVRTNKHGWCILCRTPLGDGVHYYNSINIVHTLLKRGLDDPINNFILIVDTRNVMANALKIHLLRTSNCAIVSNVWDFRNTITHNPTCCIVIDSTIPPWLCKIVQLEDVKCCDQNSGDEND